LSVETSLSKELVYHYESVKQALTLLEVLI